MNYNKFESKSVMTKSRHYCDILLVGLRENMKSLSQDSQFHEPDSKPVLR